jgi:glucose/arabinose dehydrogenase
MKPIRNDNLRGLLLIVILSAFALAGCSPDASSATAQPANPTSGPEVPVATDPAFLPDTSFTPSTAPTGLAEGPASPTPAPSPTAPAVAEATAPVATTPTPTAGAPAQAGSLPDPGAYEWRLVASGLRNAVGLANAGDGSGRLFALEKQGWIRILLDGQLMPEPFLDITDRVGSSSSERGLLGLAFHPRYEENGFFYVNYTDLNGDTVIARFNVSQDSERTDPGSEKRLLFVDQPFANHNGGGLAFGPDGTLYIALGDGGSGGDPQGNGQSLQTHLGKILRIDVDGGDPYAIPPDNPFAAGGGLPEIWAYGLRNPWRFSFDRLMWDMYIADVGQNQWEEISTLAAGSPGGANFGWDFREGSHPFEGEPPAGLDLIDPVAEYDHSLGCSVTGGFVYRGAALPEWQGVYLYGDYCTGNLWGLLRGPEGAWQNELLYQGVGQITSFGEDEAGEVYLVDQGGSIYRLSAR